MAALVFETLTPPFLPLVAVVFGPGPPLRLDLVVRVLPLAMESSSEVTDSSSSWEHSCLESYLDCVRESLRSSCLIPSFGRRSYLLLLLNQV